MWKPGYHCSPTVVLTLPKLLGASLTFLGVAWFVITASYLLCVFFNSHSGHSVLKTGYRISIMMKPRRVAHTCHLHNLVGKGIRIRNSRLSMVVSQVQGQPGKMEPCFKTKMKHNKRKMHLGYYNLYSFDFAGQTLCKSLTVLGVLEAPCSPLSCALWLTLSGSRFTDLYVVGKRYKHRQFLSIIMQMNRSLHHCFLPCGFQFCIYL